MPIIQKDRIAMAAAGMKKVLFLVNPVSGRRTGKKLNAKIIEGLKGVLSTRQYDIKLTRPDIAAQLRAASHQYETVVIAGGDGTVSMVIDAVAGLACKPSIGVIPIGTGNDLARSLGILPLFRREGISGILRVIVAGKTTSVDVLKINGALFANYFGMGIDAKISTDFDAMRSRHVYRRICSSGLGKLLYGMLAFSNLSYRVPFPVRLKFFCERAGYREITIPRNICQLLVTNTTTYAGGMVLSSKCRMDDGMFEVTVIPHVRQWFFMHFSRIFRRPFDVQWPELDHFQTRRLEIIFDDHICCQIDGEVYDVSVSETRHIEIAAGAQVAMIIP